MNDPAPTPPSPAAGSGWIVAVDVGGTFTDAVAIAEDGRIEVTKVASTPHDPAVALVGAVRELGTRVPLDDVVALFHGTTVATNAVITGKIARLVLLSTEGYRDVLSYRTGARPKLYDFQQTRPFELVQRRDRLEVRERLAWDGAVVTALTDEEIERVCDAVVERAPEAVAVSLLFSYMNGDHERRLGAALRSRLPDTPVTLSGEIAREFREYPRTATTALNAGLRPLVGSYLLRAEGAVRDLGMRRSFLIMQSNGGSVPAARADAEAHRLLLSGPTAGVAGTIALGARAGVDRLISLDMGGTSLDLCLIRDGVPPVVPMEQVETHPILAPSVDVVTIGAGGGSIATVDATGRLLVGPHSAGADPGPAAYGRGGKDATLTDAHVVVGTLGGDAPLAGRLTLDRGASHEAVGRVADQLGLTVEEAGEGIIAVAMANVVRALRGVSVERGVDPSDYTLVAFGGAGPLHAARLLRDVRLHAVVVPLHPGLFSASGLVATDLRVDESQTVLRLLEPAALPDLLAWYEEAGEHITRRLRDDGIAADRIRLVGSVDCRYLGQGYELPVVLDELTSANLEALAESFHDLHERTYGHAAREESIELVTLRLSGFGQPGRPEPAQVDQGGAAPDDGRVGRRRVVLPGQDDGRAEVDVFARDRLRAGNRIDGPAIVEEMDSTTVVLPGQEASVDQFGSLWIHNRSAR